MRPARKGPETPRRNSVLPTLDLRFNEAGPQGAGNGSASGGSWRTSWRFNEAGPQGAGNGSVSVIGGTYHIELQ